MNASGLVVDPGTGTYFGSSRREPYDRWFRYPAGFGPRALEAAFAALPPGRGRLLVDPFCGAAIAGTFGLRRGYRFVGIEAHPLVARLARAKVSSPPAKSDELVEAATRVAAAPVAASTHGEHELVGRCFTEKQLGILVGMRAALEDAGPWREHLTWALLGTLRDVAVTRVGWPYQRPGQPRQPPYEHARARFLARASMIASDLREFPLPRGVVVTGDSRSAEPWLEGLASESADACVSSPPYLNNFDYADATRLELYFLGDVRTWRAMCKEVRAGMIIATTQQSAKGRAEEDLRSLQSWGRTHEQVSHLTERLEVLRVSRRRGKEYDRVLPSYMADMARVLQQLATRMRTGGHVAWVIGDSAPYGCLVDTPGLVSLLATEMGFVRVKDEVLRRRGLRWRTNGSRHQIPLTERLLVWRAP